MIPIRVDAKPLQKLRTFLHGTPVASNRAAYRAINKTLKWVDTRARRALAAEFGLPVSALKKARRLTTIRAIPRRLSGVIWYGVSPIKASYFGKPRQTKKGAKAGKHVFPGAFVATMKSGHTGIYTRRGTARLPIDEATVPLNNAQSIVAPIDALIPERLKTVFIQELNYELSKM